MQIVIDIPEWLCDEVKTWEDVNDIVHPKLAKIMRNGAPLPKGHGRIIDESQVSSTFTWDSGYIECFAPTIIDADNGE